MATAFVRERISAGPKHLTNTPFTMRSCPRHMSSVAEPARLPFACAPPGCIPASSGPLDSASGSDTDQSTRRRAPCSHRAPEIAGGTDGSRTLRWRKMDSNPRSLPLDFRDEGQVQGGVAHTPITIFPNGSRFAVEPGGTTQVESYSSMIQGPALGSRRSERLMIAVSRQPRAGPK